ncbi:MAG: DUF262 domain-containing protein [Rhodocyclaceae bacterium]|nr:DUF262 domain-containing protein [Rhodocyclaceae bacterium]
MRIPTFQRGIAWGTDEVWNFLNSKSVLLGHVLVTKVEINTYRDLIDGLQRFATGTALLNALYPLVLKEQEAEFSLHANLFAILSPHARIYWPVVQHNHQALCNHHRDAIKDQYLNFFNELNVEIRKIFSKHDVLEIQTFASDIVRVFLQRQVAIDDFSGFASLGEAINTFIGINTIRLELGTVDLLRTIIIDKAEGAPLHWSSDAIENAENGITESFVDQGNPRKEILPLATVCKDVLSTNDGVRILEGWNTGSTPYELDAFLHFIDHAVWTIAVNKFTSEIAACGALPFSILALHYYSVYMRTSVIPPYIANGSADDNAALHRYLRATYRALLSGSIGQLGPIAERAAKGGYPTLNEVADAVNATTGAGLLSQPPTAGWVRAQLQNVNKEKAKRVFNACLLPPTTNAGGPFSPIKFSRAASDWSIDHLIPSANLNRLSAGYIQGWRIANFAPIPNQIGQVAKGTACSIKLSAGGLYSQVLAQQPTQHPYLVWIASTGGSGVSLDRQELLEPNATPDIGDQRIDKLEVLLNLLL